MGMGQDECVADLAPRKIRAGTKMTFCGAVQSAGPRERDPVPHQQGSNLPLPAAPAAKAEPAAGDAPANGADAAVNKVEEDPRATPDRSPIPARPPKGAPSVDPQAAVEGAKAPR